jgi:hypothetical protein
LQYFDIFPEASKSGVDNDFYFEPHLALFMKLQEAYPGYKKQLIYA